MPVVTISASYGAGGSELAPAIAHRLGATFIDRAVPPAVADELGISGDEAEAVAQNAPSRLWSFFARLSPMAGGPPVDEQATGDRELVERTAAHIRGVAAAGHCVVLGHAAAVVLADLPHALHVRLDGAPEGRVQAAMRQHGIDHDTASAAQRNNDRIRSGYVRHFYDADSADPLLYHLVLDTVRLRWQHCEDLVLAAARLLD